MKRRTFFRRLFGSLGAAVTSPAVDAKDRTVLIQESPIVCQGSNRGSCKLRFDPWKYKAPGDPIRDGKSACRQFATYKCGCPSQSVSIVDQA